MSLYYNSKIIATRVSPFPGEILVKHGEQVSPDTMVLRTHYRTGRLCIVNVAKHFNVPPEDIGRYVQKKEGDSAKWSETIARRTTFRGAKHIECPVDGTIEKIDVRLGVMIIQEVLERPDVPIVLDIKEKFGDSMKNLKKYILKKIGDRVEYGEVVAGEKIMPKIPIYTKKIVAPCAGKITKIDCDSGKICIQKDLPQVQMKAHYWGTIHKIIPQYGAEIEFGAYVLECAFGTGDIAWGTLVNSDADVKAHIAFAEYLSSEDIGKIIECQPAGIIVGTIDYQGIELLEKSHMTSIIIEGFGRLHVNGDYKNLLTESVGRNVILKASTQVRAGVIRPEIVIPSDREFYVRKRIEKRSKVIWGEYYGKVGEIKGSPYYGETCSGIETWLCDVLCDDGEEITLPFNNVHASIVERG